MRTPSSWGYHSFPGLIPAPQPDATMNFSPLAQLQQNPLQLPKPTQTVNLQNTTANMQALPHVYPDPRFQTMPQFPFRSTTNQTTSSAQVTTTSSGINSFNQMCPPSQMEPNGMLQAACQQLNGSPMGTMNGLVNGQFMSTINSTVNNGVVNNGLTYRPQTYIPQQPMTTQKSNMQLSQPTYSSVPDGPPNGMTFPMGRGGMLPMMSQGMGVSSMAQGLNTFSGFPTPPRSEDQNLALKQEPVDGVTDISNHVMSQGIADHVNNNTEGVLTERNGRSASPKVWRPY